MRDTDNRNQPEVIEYLEARVNVLRAKVDELEEDRNGWRDTATSGRAMCGCGDMRYPREFCPTCEKCQMGCCMCQSIDVTPNLSNARLCADCSAIFAEGPDKCPSCGNGTFIILSVMIDAVDLITEINFVKMGR